MRLLIAIMVILPLTAFAQTERSELLFQSSEGVHNFTPKFSLSFSKFEWSNAAANSVTSDSTRVAVGAEYEYGLSDLFSIGVEVGYSKAETESTVSGFNGSEVVSKGFDNIEFIFKGQYPLTGLTLKYGARLSISPGDDETEANGDSNSYTGGNGIAPMIGFEAPVGSSILGALVSREFNLGDRTVVDTGVVTKEGGGETTMIAAFWENQLNSNISLGGVVAFGTATDSTSSDGSRAESIDIWAITGYVPMNLGSGTFVPSLGYGFTTDDKIGSSNIDKFNTISLSAYYRIGF